MIAYFRSVSLVENLNAELPTIDYWVVVSKKYEGQTDLLNIRAASPGRPPSTGPSQS